MRGGRCTDWSACVFSVSWPRPHHDLDDIHSKIEEVGDHITGGSLGIGGNNLGDVIDNIASLETVIDLK